jgi:hypothetical protein
MIGQPAKKNQLTQAVPVILSRDFIYLPAVNQGIIFPVFTVLKWQIV